MFEDIDLSRYEELSDRLRLSDRKCSDGICCFLTRDFARHIGKSRTYSLGYYTIRKDGMVYEAKRYACESLDVSLKDKEIEFSCREYDSKYRPEFCKKWPDGGIIVHQKGRWREREFVPKQICTGKQLKRWREQNLEVYSFYLFDPEKYPEFEEFAIGSREGRLLVPVPALR